MIQQQEQFLSQAVLRETQLKEEELSVYSGSLNSLFIASGLFAGFSYVSTTLSGAEESERSELLNSMYFFSSSAAFAMFLIATVLSTGTVIGSSELALRGPKGSLGLSLEYTHRNQIVSFRFFQAGTMFIGTTIIIYSWIKFQIVTSITLSATLAVLALLYILAVRRVTQRLYHPLPKQDRQGNRGSQSVLEAVEMIRSNSSKQQHSDVPQKTPLLNGSKRSSSTLRHRNVHESVSASK
mmetsp:Transcript_31133/g.60675  ORF Transcript_31133/g.60675 Transcript_31133/m.60675 type:complete len:239 (+) Transcript_31133:52-768(+)